MFDRNNRFVVLIIVSARVFSRYHCDKVWNQSIVQLLCVCTDPTHRLFWFRVISKWSDSFYATTKAVISVYLKQNVWFIGVDGRKFYFNHVHQMFANNLSFLLFIVAQFTKEDPSHAQISASGQQVTSGMHISFCYRRGLQMTFHQLLSLFTPYFNRHMPTVNFYENLAWSVCVSVYFTCTCDILSMKICILLVKRGHFCEVRTLDLD